MDYPNRLEWQTRCEFNAYCKRTLRNELIDACRESRSRQKHEVNFSDLAPHEEKGDPDAMKIVVQHYQSYIAHLSMRKLRDESGNTYYGIDEDLRERLQAKLMRAVLSFKTEK